MPLISHALNADSGRYADVLDIDIKKRSNKNLKKRKNVTKKNVCKRNKKRFLFLVQLHA